MPRYFNINYELNPAAVLDCIDQSAHAPQIQSTGEKAQYVCVADGNILQMVHWDLEYRAVVNGAVFSICDSSWVPLFLKWIYGIRVPQYCGSRIFHDILSLKKYRMYFIGASQNILDALKRQLASNYDERIIDMQFVELPFCGVDDFDYESIARDINHDNPDIIWVALGAPKQEIFMSRLKPYLDRGVMIAVGAAFKFYSGVGEKRAPDWIVKCHLEFVCRLISDPKKQFQRCWSILTALPAILSCEIGRKQKNSDNRQLE